MRRSMHILVLAGILGMLAGVEEAAGGTGDIRGTVLGPDGETELQGILVYLYKLDEGTGNYHALGPQTQTSNRGRYELESLEPGTYKIQFQDLANAYAMQFYSSQKYLNEASPVTITSGTIAELPAISLSEATSISGTVTGPGDEPLGGITVSLYMFGNDEWNFVKGTETGPDGFYELLGVYPGTYRLEFTDGGGVYQTIWYSNASSADLADDVEASVASPATDINVRMQGPEVVRARFTGIQRQGNGQWQLTFTGEEGTTYHLWGQANLNNDDWDEIGEGLEPGVIEDITVEGPIYFFRLTEVVVD